MATVHSVDSRLLQRALEIGGVKSKQETVNEALREFIARREQRRLSHLFGSVEWDDSYDYKAERSRF